MSVKNLSTGKWLVRYRKRINGVVKERKQIVTGTKEEALRVESIFRERLSQKTCSLKIRTLDQALDYYLDNSEIARPQRSMLRKVKDELGNVRLGELAVSFDKYITLLKSEKSERTGCLYSQGTINRIIQYTKTALNFCVRRELIDRNPIGGVKKGADDVRDRILSEDEEYRLLNTLRTNDSQLYWALRFSLKNPIRRGDLVSLTRSNLDMTKPWIHFYPQKTKKRKKRETCLLFLDDDLLSYFASLPADCPYLFPCINDDKWRQLNDGDFNVHWHSILEKAEIEDLHWHDSKHCAITWMLDNGYTERDLKNLGIQYNDAMIDRYYHHDAKKVLQKWNVYKCGTTHGTTTLKYPMVV